MTNPTDTFLALSTLAFFQAVTTRSGFFGAIDSVVWFARVMVIGCPCYIVVSDKDGGLVQVWNEAMAKQNLKANRSRTGLVGPSKLRARMLTWSVEASAAAATAAHLAGYTSTRVSAFVAAQQEKARQVAEDLAAPVVPCHCDICGRPEGDCYGICPNADPYAGDQAREESDYSFGAQYDRWDGYREDARGCDEPLAGVSATKGPREVPWGLCRFYGRPGRG